MPLLAACSRLYDLHWHTDGPPLAVEAWWGRESLSGGFEFHLDTLSQDAFLALEPMLGQAVTLRTALSDDSRSERSGLVRTAAQLGSDGGWARYRLTVVPWTWLLTRGRHNRVFQDKSVPEILDAVFADYHEHAAWHWHEDVAPFLATARPRSYCVQYRESDYAFVSRLLAEEGLGWCIEEDADSPARHRMRLFADSTRFPEDPLSAHALGGRGIRFHRADSQEDQDSIVAFGAQHRLAPTLGTVLGYDYHAKRSIAASVPTAHRVGSADLPPLEHYDYAGQYAHASVAEAERYQRLAMEAAEARASTFLGRGTVRSLRPGSFVAVNGLPLDPATAPAPEGERFAVLDVLHVGINNLDAERIDAIAARLAQNLSSEDEDALATGDALEPAQAPRELPAALVELARRRGYGNAFDALRAELPWRPVLADDTGTRINPRPTAPGPMSAIVVGPQGESVPNGADELWCDALGRIKLRFHWQEGKAADDRSSCWVRVASRQAGAGMGWQWLPRIGQEVLVGFLGGDIDRPVVLGALYNGRGEGGIAPTPGGRAGPASDTGVFDGASDHRAAGQGNLTGGNSPAWHGAAAAGHRHPDALSGFKSKEFGARGPSAGYNQLVFDDSDQQLRVQLKSTQHASELNLGHLIHQAGNYRGSFRGSGAELRTDAWGALRAGRGIVMSTWPARHAGEPAGDFAPGMALLKQACTLADTLSHAAATHQTVKLAAAIGSTAARTSAADPDHPPLAALSRLAGGMVSARDPAEATADADAGNTAVTGQRVPHLAAPAILQVAQAGIGLVAGQSVQIAAGDTATLMSGADTNLAAAGAARIHAGQAIGLVAGAVHAGESNTGIRLIAAKDDITLQAQSDELKLLARDEMKLVSAGTNIDFAAAKKIVLSVEGGASITIDGGVTVACPGTITVHASKKSFGGPVQEEYGLPLFPKSVCKECLLAAVRSGSPFATAQ
ncbi:type VI secretion system Vgr family protein [Aromatoleum toluclasticum]|uniref:type VI secretion system Vgr family protein n=1 Tax=Aromatoleum toluclasticum TaxID=92003 RepID=UPI00037B3A73|nr:type VI secretion system Vgr family protein [Aromatoleum toluclasticum]